MSSLSNTGPETISPPVSPAHSTESGTSSSKSTGKADLRVETSSSNTGTTKENMLSNLQDKAATPGAASSTTNIKSEETKESSPPNSTKNVAIVPSYPKAWNSVELAKTEAQLISALATLLTNLNRCGSRLGLTKSIILSAGRAKKGSLSPQVWTKNVARLFGAVLKRANGIEALFKQRQADDLKYGGASGALQEFGNLHGDQYSQVRVMHHGGLVPDCRFVSVECGGQHAVALTSDGRVYSWGAGSFGKVFYFSKKLFSKFFFPGHLTPFFLLISFLRSTW
jgi:hypothetical protein